MFSPLNNVVAIIDMDGLTTNKSFFSKESFFFDLGLQWSDFTRRIGDRASMSAKLIVF